MIEIPKDLVDYALQHSDREPSILYDLFEETKRVTGKKGLQSRHMVGTLIRLLVQVSNSSKIVEVGTHCGYNTLSMAMGLPEDGRIITLDHDASITQIAQRYWDQTHLGKRIELRLGSPMESLEALKGPIDFAFINADEETLIPFWDALVGILRPGGMIVVDNVLRSGKVLGSKKDQDQTVNALNDYVRYDQRVERVMLTVRNGLTIARKI